MSKPEVRNRRDAVGVFAPILHSPWKVEETYHGEKVIQGIWANRGGPYEIKAPAQLIELIVGMQNALCDKYNDVEKKEQKLRKSEEFFLKLLRDNYE